VQWIGRVNLIIGKTVSWLTLILVLVVVVDVFLRYIFNITSAASFELEWHLFAIIFLLGSAYTLQEDRHVRVDICYDRLSDRAKIWINLSGTLLLLIPFCTVTFLESLSFVRSAYILSETSPQPGGLHGRWIIKSMIPLGFLLLMLEGVSLMLRSIKTLQQK